MRDLLLRQQMLVLIRARKRAPRLSIIDRFLFGVLSLPLTPRRILRAATVLKPSTLFRFHTALVKRKYHLLYSSQRRGKPGPKGPSLKFIQAIVQIKRCNPRFGCPRIVQQIAYTFGITIDKDIVRRVLEKHYYPDPSGGNGPSWLTVLGHAKDSLWSVDLFRCESIRLQTHWVLVVMDLFTRRIIGFAVQTGDVDGRALCYMFNQAIAKQGAPKYLSCDNDPLFKYHRWRANLRILDIEEIKTIPYTPVSHPFVERLIGTIRREYLDHVFFWNADDLERKLADFQAYYNRHRTHSSLDGDTPSETAGGIPKLPLRLNKFGWQTHCRGFFQLPIAA